GQHGDHATDQGQGEGEDQRTLDRGQEPGLVLPAPGGTGTLELRASAGGAHELFSWSTGPGAPALGAAMHPSILRVVEKPLDPALRRAAPAPYRRGARGSAASRAAGPASCRKPKPEMASSTA